MNDLKITTETQVPKGIPFNNEVFNIYTLDGQTVGHIEIQKKQVASISCETSEKPTYDIKIKETQTIKDILASEKPIDELNSKIKNKEIILEGQSSGKKLKGFFTKIGLKLAGWFN